MLPALDTDRLRLRPVSPDDCDFIIQLVNDPDWLKYIGDKGVRNRLDARLYIQEGPQASYRQHGFGLLLMEVLRSGAPAGLCGLLQRPYLQCADLGFALMAGYRGKGLAFEAAKAVILDAETRLGLNKLAGLVAPGNQASQILLTRLGFNFVHPLMVDPVSVTHLYYKG